jgi:hypothetical protein
MRPDAVNAARPTRADQDVVLVQDANDIAVS